MRVVEVFPSHGHLLAHLGQTYGDLRKFLGANHLGIARDEEGRVILYHLDEGTKRSDASPWEECAHRLVEGDI